MIHYFYPAIFYRQRYKSFLSRLAFLIVFLFSINLSYAQPQPGAALSFDGSASYVQLPAIVAGSYTKEAWINTNNLSAANNIISGTVTAFYAPGGFLTAGNEGPWNTVADNTQLLANTWYHVAVTYDATSGTMNLYKNGALVASATDLAYTETPLMIGAFNGGGFLFSGLIDEVSIWNYARTGTDIAASMNCTLSGNEPGLIAYYNFNEGIANVNNSTVTTLIDESNKCTPNNGTLINFALNGPAPASNWVAPGVTLSGGCTIVNYPKISVIGNSVCINNGDTTPSLTDSTSFGIYTGSPITVNYTITNTGTSNLNIDSIRINGANASSFSVVSSVTSPILSGASEVVQVQFTAAGFGNDSATLDIYNNDSDNKTFAYTIQCNNPAPGASLNFDGVDDYVQLPFTISGTYTKEAWINTNDISAYHNIVSGSVAAFAITNTGQLIAGNSQPYNTVTDPTPLLTNTWYHVAVTYDSTTGVMNLYKNGVLVNDSIDHSYNDIPLEIGALKTGFTWSGNIDEVRIWNVVRTQAQINSSMNCRLTGDEPGLLAYYNFSNGFSGINNTGIPADSILPDLSHKCQAYNGQLENFALNGPTSNWENDSPAVAGSCGGMYPNLGIAGNYMCIANGDTTPTSSNNTYFGISGSMPITEMFVIHNIGSATLNIDSVKIAEAVDTDFIITQNPTATVAAGDSTYILVSFFAKALGDRFADVAVYSSDSGKAPFQFEIQGAGTVILPVNFLSFNGVADGAVANLAWKTNIAPDTKGFEILRSPDGVSNWTDIGFTGATASGVYNFTDASPLAGINTYRLKEIDANGNSAYSSIVALDFSTKGSGISLYPNPAKDAITIFFNNDALLNTPVQLSTITGRVIFTTNLASGQQQIDLSKLPQGIYLLTFSNGDVKRVVKE